MTEATPVTFDPVGECLLNSEGNLAHSLTPDEALVESNLKRYQRRLRGLYLLRWKRDTEIPETKVDGETITHLRNGLVFSTDQVLGTYHSLTGTPDKQAILFYRLNQPTQAALT